MAVADVTAPPEGTGLGDWLASVRARFYALEGELLNLQHRAAVIAAEARQRGDTFTADTARAAVVNLGDLRLAYGAARDRFDSLRAAVPGLGQILIPLAYSAVAVALAAAIYGIFRRATAQEKIVDLLEAGQLTPAEAAALAAEARGGDPLASIVSSGAAVAALGLAYLVLRK